MKLLSLIFKRENRSSASTSLSKVQGEFVTLSSVQGEFVLFFKEDLLLMFRHFKEYLDNFRHIIRVGRLNRLNKSFKKLINR